MAKEQDLKLEMIKILVVGMDAVQPAQLNLITFDLVVQPQPRIPAQLVQQDTIRILEKILVLLIEEMGLELEVKLVTIKIHLTAMDAVQHERLNRTIFEQVDHQLQKTLVQHEMLGILQIQVKQLAKQYVEMV